MSPVVDVDDAMVDPSFWRDPYPFWAQVRATNPVSRARSGMWVLTRYADVETALRDLRFSCEQARMNTRLRMLGQPAAESMERVFGRSMLHLDPPEHTRLRRLVNASFTQRRIGRMRPLIEHIAHLLIDEVAPDGEMDFIADFAYALPITVIFERFGIPFADRPALARLIRRHRDGRFRLVTETATEQGTGPLDDAAPRTSIALETMERTAMELSEYLADLLRSRADGAGNDLLSEMLRESTDDTHARDPLVESELVGTAMLLLIAGQETTINLLGNGMLALLRHPAQFDLLARDPTLVPSAVEEMLRFDTPIQVVPRVLRDEIELGGHRLAERSEVLVVLAAANHDPARFNEPDSFDVTRRRNAHLGFGGGVHHCVGGNLARTEADVAVRVLLERCPRLYLAEDTHRWRPNPFLRGLESLQVGF